MKVLRFLSMLVIASINIGMAAAADSDTVPTRFTFKFQDAPIWISSAEAITPTGALRSDVSRPEHLKLRLSQLQLEAGRPGLASETGTAPCDITFGERIDDGPDDFPVRSMAELADVAVTRSVISGVVTASAVGLHDGIPHTVLQIDTDATDHPTQRVYLMYPRGRLRFDNVTLCNEDPTFADVPEIGDSIVFVASAPIDTTGTLFVAASPWVLYEHRAVLVAPPVLRADITLRAMSSVRAVADHLRAKPQADLRR